MKPLSWFVEVNKTQRYVVFYKHHEDLGDNFSVHDINEAWEIDEYIGEEKGRFKIFHFLHNGRDQHTSELLTGHEECKCGKSIPESWLMFARLAISSL